MPSFAYTQIAIPQRTPYDIWPAFALVSHVYPISFESLFESNHRLLRSPVALISGTVN